MRCIMTKKTCNREGIIHEEHEEEKRIYPGGIADRCGHHRRTGSCIHSDLYGAASEIKARYEKKKEQYLVKENDLLIARTGATTG